MSIDPEAARDLLLPTRAPSGVLRRSIHESDSEGLYFDRVDDRGCDHRHSGRSSTAGVPGLQQPGEDIRGDLGCERMPHLDYRGLPKWHELAWSQQLGLRSHKHHDGRGLEVRKYDFDGRQREGHGGDTGLCWLDQYQRYGGHPGPAEKPGRHAGADGLYRRRWNHGLRLALWQQQRRHELEPEVPAWLLPRLTATS